MDVHGNYDVQDRMNRILSILATFQRNVNDDKGDKHLADANIAIQAIEDVTFARSEFDLDLLKRDGWFPNG